MKTTSVLFILTFHVFICAQTPNLSGTWQGILTQPSSAILSDNFAFWLSIEQKGVVITGLSRIEVTNTNNFGIIEFTAEYVNGNLNFQETKITDENIVHGAYWCIKHGSLLYDEKEKSLRGPWYSTSGCGPGEIIVYKTNNKFNKSTAQSNDYSTFEDLNKVLVDNGTITGRKIVLSYVHFDSNQTKIKAESKPLLKDLITFLKLHQRINIRISGHTDDVGDDAYNLKLSIQRAKAVVDYLIAQGIQTNRLSYEGFGESRPIEKNDTEKGREMNRRIEFEVVE